jgi:hypothetical protein
MTATPANWIIGTAASAPTARHDQIGVCRSGLTSLSSFDPGSRSSRAIPKQSRIVEVMIDRQQTKIAAATTSRKTVENAFPKFASMISAGPQLPEIAVFMFGIPSSIA